MPSDTATPLKCRCVYIKCSGRGKGGGGILQSSLFTANKAEIEKVMTQNTQCGTSAEVLLNSMSHDIVTDVINHITN